MATPNIPTRIRQNVRDLVTSPSAPLAATTARVAATLGYPVALDPEWGMLWAALRAYYPDQATFVPTVVAVVTNWCHAFTTWLEDGSNEEAVERFLDGLKGVGSLKLEIEIAAPSSARPTTTWRASTRSFVLALPQARPGSAQTALAGFASDLLQLFTHSPSLLPVSEDPSAAVSRASTTTALDDPDAWAELTLDSPQTQPATRPTARAPRAAPHADADDPLPPLATLLRPEDLLQRPPYRLIVRQEGRQRVLVESSHAASLRLLEAYLSQWVRGNAELAHRPGVAAIALREAAFGLGLLHDTLVVEAAGRGREVNALLVLAVVEGVLGFELVSGGAAGGGATVGGGVWEFRRVRGFR